MRAAAHSIGCNHARYSRGQEGRGRREASRTSAGQIARPTILSPMASPPGGAATPERLFHCCPATPSATAAATAGENATQPRNWGKEQHRGCREGIIARLLSPGTRGLGRHNRRGPILGRDDRARLDRYPAGQLSLQCPGRLRADCPDAPFLGSVLVGPGGPWRCKKKTAPGLGGNRAGVPAGPLTAHALRVVTAYRHAGGEAG